MDYQMIEENDIKFPIPSNILISGPSHSGLFLFSVFVKSKSLGKTNIVLKFIKYADKLFNPLPKEIVYAYGEFSPTVTKLQKFGVKCVPGVPSEEFLSKIKRPFLFILDDLVTDIDSRRLEAIFVKQSHHQQFCAIFLTVIIFYFVI